MTCEEFEAIGLDADRDASLGEIQRASARAHAASCSRCAALQNSWHTARLELRSLAEETAAAQAPPRVEMRLRQEFRTRHHTVKVRRAALIAARRGGFGRRRELDYLAQEPYGKCSGAPTAVSTICQRVFD